MQRTVTSTLVLTLALVGCGKSEDKAPTKAPEPLVQKPETPARPAPIDGGLQAHMRGHFESIHSIELAITQGNMEEAKAQATKLASHQSTEEVESYTEEVQAVRDAATAVAQGDSLGGMAASAALLASQCGHCHIITSSITSFEWTEAPMADSTGPDRMQRHRWAMERLWEGLVGPSQSSWTAGAAVLKADPVPASVLTLKGMPEEEAKAKLTALQELATRAESAITLPTRTTLYGELLGTCSACHTKVQAGK